MCRKLEVLEDPHSGMDRLILTVPPRHTKSETATKTFPAWCIGRDPWRPVIVTAYALSLARDFSARNQAILQSPFFAKTFPGVRLNPRRNALENWCIISKDKAGNEVVHTDPAFIAAGVGGPITGKGGWLLVIDDPFKNIKEAESDVIRDGVFKWYQTTFRTRLAPGGKILVIMTRWHEDDLVGRLLEAAKSDPQADQYEIYNLPAEALEDEKFRKKGEALHPSRYPIEELHRIRATLGERYYQALYQGNPVPPEGAMCKRTWFQRRVQPFQLPFRRVGVRFWDWAVTDPDEASIKSGDPDYTVGTKVTVDDTLERYVEDVVRGQWEWPDARKMIMDTARLDGQHIPVVLEQIAKDKAILRDLKRELRAEGFTVTTRQTRVKKGTSAMYFAQLAQSKMVTLVAGDWISPWLAEICAFPYSKHDDQMDSVAGAMNFLQGVKPADIDTWLKKIKKEQEKEPDWMDLDKVEDAHRKGHLKRAKKVEGDEEYSYRQAEDVKAFTTDVRGIV